MPGGSPNGSARPHGVAANGSFATGPEGPVAGGLAPQGLSGGVSTGGVSGDPEAAATLAIPGYDSLSAMQVVQRLPGLTPAELTAVRAYEARYRGRKTILNRADQLLSGSTS